MSWDRNKSTSEQLMVEVLADTKQALTLDEIVSEIQRRDPSALTGKTPKNSLYSVVYRREKRRAERGLNSLFKTKTRGSSTYYSLNLKGMDAIGDEDIRKMKIPHVIPYQGSKRKLAPQILDYIQHEVKGTVYEPFAGSAAITIAAATSKIGNSYVIGDKFSPLISLWELIIKDPNYVAEKYERIWNEQLDDPKSYFLDIRKQFNSEPDPVKLLYLVARCVKNAIRFNANGEFNQSSDNRRLGMRPEKVSKESFAISSVLEGKTKLVAGDFMEILQDAGPDDLVYMDPPWQGTSLKKDPRYAYLLDIDELIAGLKDLNERGVPYLLSFDGTCGDKSYGKKLPDYLKLERVDLNAGRSSQATLLGRDDVTIESLYLSPVMIEKNQANVKNHGEIKIFA